MRQFCGSRQHRTFFSILRRLRAKGGGPSNLAAPPASWVAIMGSRRSSVVSLVVGQCFFQSFSFFWCLPHLPFGRKISSGVVFFLFSNFSVLADLFAASKKGGETSPAAQKHGCFAEDGPGSATKVHLQKEHGLQMGSFCMFLPP